MKKIIFILIISLTAILSSCDTAEKAIIDSTIKEEISEVGEELDTNDLNTKDTEDTKEDIDSSLITDNDDAGFGSTGALNSASFSLEEMLIYAIQDEYAARAEYEYILDNFDVTNPFSNIIKSEETHIELLIPLFQTYNYAVPTDTSSEHLITINSLQETYEIGVQAEILNIAMYNLFLEDDTLPQDVIDVFTRLRDASVSHQAAFEKNANK